MEKHEVAVVVERLVQIYEAVKDIPASQSSETLTVTLIDGQPPSRLDCVRDRRTGLEYAAWCIGETLATIGGRDLMEQVYSEFEEWAGPRGSSWLDHRWNGAGAGWFA